uniref:Monooxygenase FAD-binding n=1 Tax=Cyanothece sp. (strain PCC 7425 / ATCC 29141) TaxID=395961 RepID=B8HRF7_CYAP4
MMDQFDPVDLDAQSNHAIVIGGSIAGLLAARVLSDHFERVTVIERDGLPPSPSSRSGTPQSLQPHVLLVKGYRILEQLFPGIGLELAAAGAIELDWTRQFYHFTQGRWNVSLHTDSPLRSFTCSRPLLEWAIRQRVCRLARVQVLTGQRVTGLLSNTTGNSFRHGKATCITGVCYRSAQTAEPKQLQAALVVDASGRGTNTPQWLQELGWTPPAKTIVDPGVGYATRRYRLPEAYSPPWKVMLIDQIPPDQPRLAYLAAIENGEWIATLGGYGRDYPPLTESDFLAFARTLAAPDFYEAIKAAQPTSDIRAHRATANRLYHYETAQLPPGLIALGDAVCALCPVYGQGMTVSALSALVLQNWLNQQPSDRLSPQYLSNTRQFQQQVARSNGLAWKTATQLDSRFPSTKGRIPAGWLESNLQVYMERLIRQAQTDPELRFLYTEIVNFLKPPLAFYHPKIIWQVLRQPGPSA